MRDFIDSLDGRHFADAVADELARGTTLKNAIEAPVARWMGWRTDRRTSRATRIPLGHPYPTGIVTHFAIFAEMGSGGT